MFTSKVNFKTLTCSLGMKNNVDINSLLPKQKKKKKVVVSRREFIDPKNKIDHILTAITCQQTPQPPSTQSLNSFEERLKAIEERENLTSQRTTLEVEMGIQKLDQQRQADHKEFIKKNEDILSEFKELKE